MTTTTPSLAPCGCPMAHLRDEGEHQSGCADFDGGINVLVVAGRLAVEPELRTFESGTEVLRLLVTVRSEHPRRRVDVLPVTLWEPADDEPLRDARAGQRVWIAGSVQRRFWESSEGRRSRLELVATQAQLMDRAPRQFCCVCLTSTEHYRSLRYEVPRRRTFHYCEAPDCAKAYALAATDPTALEVK